MRTHRLLRALATLTAGFALTACPDEGKRPIGASCSDDAECTSGICAGSECLDPTLDSDLDGIVNGVEAQLGSDPLMKDTDGDSIEDGDEIDTALANVDTDQDSLADIVESATADADQDCIPDQYDARNTTPDSDLSPMVAVVCPTEGVCAGKANLMQVECSTGTARCVLTSVAGYESPEGECDGVDENCDGVADDGFPDRDSDGDADCVDVDWDNDDVADATDNCPALGNSDQADGDDDGVGNACVNDYELVLLTAPATSVVAGATFGVTVGLAAVEESDAPMPRFTGTVTLTLQGGPTLGGTLTQAAGADGVATFDDLTIDAPGENVAIVASSGDLGQGRSAAFDVTAGAPTQLLFEGLAASATAGEEFSFTLVAADDDGNAIPGFTGRVTFSADDGSAILPDPYTFTAADAGRHTFAGNVIRLAGAHTITAASANLTGEGTVTIDAAAFAGLRLQAPDGDEVAAGDELSVVVVAADEFGNAVPDYSETVALTSTDADAILPADLEPDGGLYAGTVGARVAGPQTLTATDSAGESATLDYTVLPGAAAAIELAAPSSIGPGAAFSATVTVRDAFDNVADNFRGAVALSSSDGAATLPSAHTFTAGDAGVYAFTNVRLATIGSQTLTATSGALEDQVAVTVATGAASQVAITNAPAQVTAGVAFTLGIEFQDGNGSPATDASREVTVEADGDVIGTFTVTTSVATLPDLIVTTAGSVTITVSGGGFSDTATVTVVGGAATTLSVTGPAAAVAGAAFNVVVSARDAFGNIAPGYRGVVHFTHDDPNDTSTVPADYTFVAGDAGVHTFTGGARLQTTGARHVTATDVATASITGTLSVSIGGGAATRITLTGPSDAVLGVPFDVTVTAYDAAGNIAAGYTGTVSFSGTVVDGKPAPDLPATYTFVAGDAGRHVFTGSDAVTFFAAGAMQLTANDQTPLPNAVSTIDVDVAAATATRFTLTRAGAATIAAGAPFSVTLTAYDDNDNVATGYTGTVTFTSDDTHTAPAPVLPASYTFVAGDAGTKTFTGVTLYTAGARTVTADDGTISEDLAVTIDPGAASALRFVTAPVDGVAGVPQAVAVAIADTYGNPTASTAQVNLALTTNPGRALLTGGQQAAVAGVATFAAFSLDRPGAGYVVTASSNGLASLAAPAFAIVWQAPTVGTPSAAAKGNCVDVTYSASHNLARPIDVRVEYNPTDDSPDAGWMTATQCGAETNAAADPKGVNRLHVGSAAANYVFRWNALGDLGAFDARTVDLRVTTSLGPTSTTSATAPYTFDASWTARYQTSNASVAVSASAVGDVDRDGFDDLILGATGGSAIYWARNDGTGRYEAPTSVNIDVASFSAKKMVAAVSAKHYNGDDGRPEVAIVDGGSDRVIVAQFGSTGGLGLGDWTVLSPVCGGAAPFVSDAVVMPQNDYYSRFTLAFACEAAKKVEIYNFSGAQWQLRQSIDVSAYGAPTALASADFDHNGEGDLAIGLASGGVVVWGAPISVDYPDYFQSKPIAGIKRVTGIALGDLDKDGDEDMVIADDEATAKRLFFVDGEVTRDANDGLTRLFAAGSSSLAIGALPTVLAIGDVDRDGWDDITYGSYAADQVSVLRSHGFGAAKVIEDVVDTGTSADGVNTINLADMTGDGWLDVAVTRASTVNVRRIGTVIADARLECDPTWSGPAAAPSFGYSLTTTAAADVDGDGRSDLVHGLDGGNSLGGVVIAYGRGNGRFASDEDVVFSTEDQVSDVAVGDLDNDGDLDVAAIDGGVVAVYKQAGRYQWTQAVLGALPPANGGLLVADVDLDRKDDLVWIEVGANGASKLHVFLQGNAGAFTAAVAGGIAIGNDANALAASDLNADGRLDFAVGLYRPAQTYMSLCTFLSTGPATWATAVADGNCAALRDGTTDLTVGDLVGFANVDSDAALELVVEVDGGPARSLQVRSASTAGLFDQVEDDGSNTTNPPGYQLCGDARGAVFGRFGGDAAQGLDVAVRCSNDVRTFGRAAGKFGSKPIAVFGDTSYTGSLAAADFDGDQLVDVVDAATVFPLDQVPTREVFNADPSSAVAFGDMNGDGFEDVVSIGAATVSIALQKPGSGGALAAPVAIDIAALAISTPVIGDFDGDDRMDIAFLYANASNDQGLAVLTQQGFDGLDYFENTYPLRSGSIGYVTPVTGDWDEDGSLDVAFLMTDANFATRVAWALQYSPGLFDVQTSSQVVDYGYDLAAGRVKGSVDGSLGQDGVVVTGVCGVETSRPCVTVAHYEFCDGLPCDVVKLTPKSTEGISSVAVGDLDRDGLDDIVILQGSSSVYVPSFFLQGAAGSFAEYYPAPADLPVFTDYARDLFVADFDRDGWLDLGAFVQHYDGDYSMSAFEISLNTGKDPLVFRTDTLLEGASGRVDDWFVGDFGRTGRPSLGHIRQQDATLVLKR